MLRRGVRITRRGRGRRHISNHPKKCIKKTNALSKCSWKNLERLVEKFREVSDSVWVSFEAVIIEKTLKED